MLLMNDNVAYREHEVYKDLVSRIPPPAPSSVGPGLSESLRLRRRIAAI